MAKTLVRGNRDLIKAINRNLLLNIIRREGELSRTQLTETSGLSAGAVSQIITDLLAKNWLLETGEGDYTGGRRQTILRLNPQAGYAVGLKLMEDRVVAAVTDFEAHIVHYDQHPLGIDKDADTISRNLASLVEKTISAAGIARARVFGVGIGLAGIIYPHSGIVHYSPFFGWHDFPLAQRVQECLGLAVSVENDVNTLTLSEHLFGAGRHHSDFVVVTVGRGIGMGIIINGRLYQGLRGGAGELGHVVVDLSLARSTSTANGTLEGNAADPAVLRSAFVPHQAGASNLQLEDVVARAEAGVSYAQEALARSGEYLGAGLAMIINILCPPLIIVSGEGVAAGDWRLGPMMDAMRRYTFHGLLDGVQVLIEPTDDQAWARGAASLVISKVFESPLVEGRASV